MKKVISTLMMMCVVAIMANTYAQTTVNYYVSPTGDDANDGLSEGAALSTLTEAFTKASAEGMATTYIVNVGEGQIEGNSFVFACSRAEDITLKVIGKGTATTYFERVTDAEFAENIKTDGNFMGKVFNKPRNTGAGKLIMEVEDITFRNFGYTTDAAGALLEVNNNEVEFTLRRCNVVRAVARRGALVVNVSTSKLTLNLEDCFFDEIYSYNKGGLSDAAIDVRLGTSLAIQNCVFSNFGKINPSGGAASNSPSVIEWKPNSSASFSLVNNTFIGNSNLDLATTETQSTLRITKINDITANVTIANNIFIGNSSAATSSDYYDVIVDPNGNSDFSFIENSNNVLTSQMGLGTLNNTIDPAYTYTSEDINFTMAGDYPEKFTANSGVNYVKANGIVIFEGGLSSVAPMYDIAGNMRSTTNPCVGAFEAIDDGIPSEVNITTDSGIKLYPNPVLDKLNIYGDVAQVVIYNVAGVQVMFASNVAQGIDVGQLKAGIYLVMCKDAQGTTFATQRIMKK